MGVPAVATVVKCGENRAVCCGCHPSRQAAANEVQAVPWKRPDDKGHLLAELERLTARPIVLYSVPMTKKSYYTITEAARVLGVTRESVWKAIHAGRLKARLRSITTRVWAIAPASVEDYEVSASHQERGQKTLTGLWD